MTRDPLGETGGLNLYGFVSNDSVNNIDLLGLFEERECSSYTIAGNFQYSKALINIFSISVKGQDAYIKDNFTKKTYALDMHSNVDPISENKIPKINIPKPVLSVDDKFTVQIKGPTQRVGIYTLNPWFDWDINISGGLDISALCSQNKKGQCYEAEYSLKLRMDVWSKDRSDHTVLENKDGKPYKGKMNEGKCKNKSYCCSFTWKRSPKYNVTIKEKLFQAGKFVEAKSDFTLKVHVFN